VPANVVGMGESRSENCVFPGVCFQADSFRLHGEEESLGKFEGFVFSMRLQQVGGTGST
jgi:hypothetical protein